MTSDQNISRTSKNQETQYIPPISGQEENRVVKGKVPSDSIGASQTFPCLGIPAPSSPLPLLCTDTDIDVRKLRKEIQQNIEQITLDQTPSESEFEALSSLDAFTSSLKKLSTSIPFIFLNLNERAIRIAPIDSPEVVQYLGIIDKLTDDFTSTETSINHLINFINDSEKNKKLSQKDLEQLNDQIESAHALSQSGVLFSESNPYVELLTRIKTINLNTLPPLSLPTNLVTFIGWLQSVRDGRHKIGSQLITSIESLFPGSATNSTTALGTIATGLLSNYETLQRNIDKQNNTININQDELNRLKAKLSENKAQKHLNVNQLLDAIKAKPIADETSACLVASQLARANKLASKIEAIADLQNNTAGDMGIEALKAFITIQALINKSNTDNQITVAEQGQKTSRLSLDEAALQLSLANQLAAVARQIQEDQAHAADLQTKIKDLGYTADALSGALAAATVGCIFAVGCAAIPGLSAALGAVLAAKGALECKLGALELKISSEQVKEAKIGRELAEVKAGSEQLSQASGTFVDLVSQISKAITEATKEAAAAIDAFNKSSSNLSDSR